MRRAMWMSDPMSAEFRTYFYEMVTEIRRLSGREFNADATLSDLHHALSRLFERFPAAGQISLDSVLKAADSIGTYSKLTDLLAVSTAVTSVFLPAGAVFVGGAVWMVLRTFAPSRLKCALAMGIGGVLASDLYRIPEPPPGKAEREQSVFPAILLPIILLAAGALFPLGAVFLRMPAAAFLGTLLFGVLLVLLAAALLIFTLLARMKRTDPEPSRAELARAFTFETADPLTSSVRFLFAPGPEERRFAASLSWHLASAAIERAPGVTEQAEMRLRLERWKAATETMQRAPLMTSASAFSSALRQASREMPEPRRLLILADCALQSPFDGLEEPGGKQLSSRTRRIPPELLESAARELSVKLDFKRLRAAYAGAITAIDATDTWKKILGGLTGGVSKNPAGYLVLPVTTAPLAFPVRDGEGSIAGGYAFLSSADVVKTALSSPEALRSALAKLEAVWKLLEVRPGADIWALEILEGLRAARELIAREANIAGQGKEELRRALRFYESSVRRWTELAKGSRTK
jgi:hypothetical protein